MKQILKMPMYGPCVMALIASLLILACGTGSYEVVGEYDPTTQSYTGVVAPAGSVGNCPALPETITQSDLVGTWKMFAGGTGEETLILKDNGTYKQIHDYAPMDYHYESEWRTWHFERQDNGTALIRFQDMMICSWNCFLSADTETKQRDPCSKKMITVEANERVFNMIGDMAGSTPQPTTSSKLMMFEPSLDPDSNPIVYEFER